MSEMRPPDPLFARRASELLAQGLVDEAIALCMDGTAQYPWYATGALVLGECLEAKGRYTEAAEQYRRALAIHPDSYLLHRLLSASEQLIQHMQAPGTAVEPRAEEVTSGHIGTVSTHGTAESSVEFMLRRLAEAKGTTPGVPPSSTAHNGDRKPASSSRIVTVTLAEIYASQGEYGEAAHAYRQLIRQRPEDADRLQRRLAELEELARLQKGNN